MTLRDSLHIARCAPAHDPGEGCLLPRGHGGDHNPSPTPVEIWGPLTRSEIRQLRDFKAERDRGLVHTEEWGRLMLIQQFRYSFEVESGVASWSEFRPPW